MINSHAAVSYRQWGEYAGCPVHLFRLQNISGAYVELTNYGATLISAVMPDRNGNFESVVLGYSSLADYVNDRCYMGATIGRFANRIGGAKFTLDGATYQLDANDGNNINHGGNNGFNAKVFDYAVTCNAISFTYLSKEGDGGFSGNLTLTVTYRLTDVNELHIDFRAVTDKKTVANFTNHAYFNLAAKDNGIFDHLLKVYADDLLDADDAYVPNGAIKPAGSKVLNGEAIGDKMMIDREMLVGFNDCYVLQNAKKEILKPAAELTETVSGRQLTVYTTYPSMIVYTGDYLDSEANGIFSRPYKPFDGLCLECQYYPDSPNHAHFPSTVLNPGEEYNETIVYKFSLIS